jgi:hypothetical protein
MNKWQIVDYIHWNLDGLTETDIWSLVDEISDKQALDMTNTWLYNSQAPGQIHTQAQGIIEWYQQRGFITPRQRRWLVMSIIAYWDTTSAGLYACLPV